MDKINPAPAWADTVRRHGEPDEWDTGVIRHPEERPFISPGPPPRAEGWITTARSHRSSQRPSGLVIWIGVAVVVTLAAILGLVIWMWSSEDSGVAACRAISEGKRADGQPQNPEGTKITVEEYQGVRELFARSAYPEIRDPGTKLVDIVWQLQGNPDAALLYGQELASASASLAGGCAAHGYVLPQS
jgi:hypothetical protein